MRSTSGETHPWKKRATTSEEYRGRDSPVEEARKKRATTSEEYRGRDTSTHHVNRDSAAIELNTPLINS